MSKRMRWEAWVKILLALAMGLAGVASPRLVGAAYAMQIATTTVADTVYHADGTTATGTAIINWPTFTTMTGELIQGGTQSVTIGTGGALSVGLVPNVGATPIGTYYTVVYHLNDGSVQKEYWVVPMSGSPVTIAAVKNTVLPTSVAMQTVSKSYVDTAIAQAVTGHPLDSSPYVVKTGDTMSGPLVLPGDPVSAAQAADKHYVDASVASLAGATNGKVVLLPSATQVVTQPAGTDLEANRLNGEEYASQYATIPNTNGIANATTSTDCSGAGAAGLGCDVTVEPTIPFGENYLGKPGWGNQTHVRDLRLGGQHDTYFNPKNPNSTGKESAQGIDVTTTDSTQAISQATGAQIIDSVALDVVHTGLAGGSNLYSNELGGVPFFKTTYSASQMAGTYNTQGQHVLGTMETNCYAVGDCLIGSQFLVSAGGYRDNADEGTHPYDIFVREDAHVYTGLCSTGCTTGSQSVVVGSQTNGGTQGDGRYLIDKNPAKVISTGTLTGGSDGLYPVATFTGTSFPVSTFFQTAALVPSQAQNIAPGTVSVALATTGVPSGFSTNTAAAPSSSGVACVAVPGTLTNWEMAPYTVVDGTHLQMTLLKPHGAGATIAIGGLCGYGLEQTVDTRNGIRQVFPVVGSYAANALYYAGSLTGVVGQMAMTSGFANLSFPIVSAVRSGNVVTATVSTTSGVDVTGLTMTVAGVADSSYNGSFVMTSTGSTTVTYPEVGANSTTTGGTISLVTGGYALYPMAEVLSVYNPATKSADGLFTLAPNTVAWAANDAVEEPHYFQAKMGGDTTLISQALPRPRQSQSPGYTYLDNVGPFLRGFLINNAADASSYFGSGGTHGYPSAAYVSLGIWATDLEAQAGETAAFVLHCNSKGCNRWDSAYDLFELNSSAGVDTINYSPQTSNLTMKVRGTPYSFTPTGFTAGTANITTLNVTTLNTTSAASTGALTAASVASTGALTAASVASTGALTGSSVTVTGTDTSAAVNTGVVTATTLNGALDASNITSGTLNAARMPLATASTAGAVTLPAAGQLMVPSASGLVAMKKLATGSTTGASYGAGTGVAAPSIDSYAAMLMRDSMVDNSVNNFAFAGLTSYQIAARTLKYYQPVPTLANLLLYDVGDNDGIQDVCGGTAGTNCMKNTKYAQSATLAWGTIPYQFRRLASKGTTTGTCVADNTTVPVFQSTVYTAQGTPMSCTSTGATVTLTVSGSPAATVAGLTYIVTNGSTGTFTVTLDGSAVTDQISGTTTFSAGPAGGQNLVSAISGDPTSVGPMRQQFTVTPASTHTFVITTGSATAVKIIAADVMPPAGNANTNVVAVVGPPSPFQYASMYNTLAANSVAAISGAGGSAFYVSLLSGNFFNNVTADTAVTATQSCYGSIATNHPNNCGMADIEQDILNAELANGMVFSANRGGGKSTGYTGVTNTIQATLTGTDRAGSHHNLNVSQALTAPVGLELLSARSANGAATVGGAGLDLLPSGTYTGKPWSGHILEVLYSNLNSGLSWICPSTLYTPSGTNNTGNAQTDYTPHACFDLSGNQYMDGLVVQQIGTTIATGTGTNLTVTPTTQIVSVSGTGSIQTITPPAGLSSTFGACLNLIPTGAFTTVTGGNIAVASTATVGRTLTMCWSGTAWNPSY